MEKTITKILIVIILGFAFSLIYFGYQFSEIPESEGQVKTIVPEKEIEIEEDDEEIVEMIKGEELPEDKEEVPSEDIIIVEEDEEIPESQDESGSISDEGETHIVEITKFGFKPNRLKISVGDTVEWRQAEDSPLPKVFIQGAQKCNNVRSGYFTKGESFKHTFYEPAYCNFIEGSTTTIFMNIIVG